MVKTKRKVFYKKLSLMENNLSDNIWEVDDKIKFIQKKDVKKFIKSLKKEFSKSIPMDSTNHYQIHRIIDKLAGDKLI